MMIRYIVILALIQAFTLYHILITNREAVKHQTENELRISYIEEQKKINDADYKAFVDIQESIMALGASAHQATTIIEAADEHSISPRVLAALIFTESSFNTNVTHDIRAVKGVGGVHTKYWDDTCPYNPRNEEGSIYAAAWILAHHLEDSKGNYLKALTAYKGKSKEGKRRAQQVLDIRKEMQ